MTDLLYVDSGYNDSSYFTYIAVADSTLNSSYTINVIPDKIFGITILQSNFTISATPTVNRSTQITLDTIITLNEQAVTAKTSSSNLNASYSETSIVNAKLSGSSNLNSLYNINANVNTTKSSSSSLTSQYSLYDVGNIKTGTSALLIDSATLTANVNTNKYGTCNLNSNYNLTSSSSSVKFGEIHLNSIFTIYEYAIVPSFQYVYKISAESREYKILPESRIYKIRK